MHASILVVAFGGLISAVVAQGAVSTVYETDIETITDCGTHPSCPGKTAVSTAIVPVSSSVFTDTILSTQTSYCETSATEIASTPVPVSSTYPAAPSSSAEVPTPSSSYEVPPPGM